jgi:hypothetical protein
MSRVGWEDFEKPNYASIRGGLAGQSGHMPNELHLKKMEQTCMYESEDQLNDFFRSTLKDRTPEAAAYAQDLPRETQDMVRSEVMNLRHTGARTAAEPIHPDLFLGFTDRDKRGYHNSGPDFREYAKQSSARGRFKDFVSDHASDWTIPEGTRSNLRVHQDLRKTMAATKERTKIFDTAFDSYANPYQGTRSGNASTAQMVDTDGVVLNLNNAPGVYQRKDNTTLKGDLIKVGYRQTGDHRFAVAQYGITSAKQKYANIHAAQNNVEQDRKFDIHPTELKTRLMINMIKEVGRRKHLDVYKTETDFNESVHSKNQIKKLTADLSTTQRNVKQTADVKELGYVDKNIKKVRVYDPVSHDTVVVDKDIFSKVNEHKNVTFVKKIEVGARNTLAKEGYTASPGDNVEVHVYSRKRPNILTPLPVKTEHKWHDANYTPLYKRGALSSKNMNSTYADLGQGVNPSANKVMDRLSKAHGYTQGIRSEIDTEQNISDITDVSGFAPRKMRGRTSV